MKFIQIKIKRGGWGNSAVISGHINKEQIE